jgi:ABC-type sugar transport system ATPase subunit
LLARAGSSLDTRKLAAGLSIANQQRLELASALAHNARVWVFDETTAPLTRAESADLFALMRRLADDGCSVMMVSHHLEEVFAHADRITVLRDGRKVCERLPSEAAPAEIVRHMVGRDVASVPLRGSGGGEIALYVSNLSGDGFADVSLDLRAGEVVGMFGLVGAGRTEVVETLFGLRAKRGGDVAIDGRRVEIRDPYDARRQGIALVPEDRRSDGLMVRLSVEFNATLAHLRALSSRGITRRGRLRAAIVSLARSLNIRYRNGGQPVDELSGGNQQKVALARWLLTEPRILILDEPTRGVDVAAKSEIHSIIREQANSGRAVLLVSSDLPEVLAVSDRVVVMKGGAVVATLDSSEASEAAVMFAATGAAQVS